jgi:hypothetical protein
MCTQIHNHSDVYKHCLKRFPFIRLLEEINIKIYSDSQNKIGYLSLEQEIRTKRLLATTLQVFIGAHNFSSSSTLQL